MLITLSRRTVICQSDAEVQLTGVAPLGAGSHRFNFFKQFLLYQNCCTTPISIESNIAGGHIHNATNQVQNSERNSPMRARSCQLTTGLTSICSQAELSDLSASLGVTCSRHVKTPSRCCLSARELSLQIPHDSGLALIPYTDLKLFSQHGSHSTAFCSMSTNQYARLRGWN